LTTATQKEQGEWEGNEEEKGKEGEVVTRTEANEEQL